MRPRGILPPARPISIDAGPRDAGDDGAVVRPDPALHRQLISETGPARPLVFERDADCGIVRRSGRKTFSTVQSKLSVPRSRVTFQLPGTISASAREKIPARRVITGQTAAEAPEPLMRQALDRYSPQSPC